MNSSASNMIAQSLAKRPKLTTNTATATITNKAISDSLHGPPIRSLVPPGNCQFGESFTPVKLLERHVVSPTSYNLRFGLPDPTKPLNLSTCACLLLKANIRKNASDEEKEKEQEEPIIRPYTPISTNAQIGSFDLLVKKYPQFGIMSKHLCDTLQVGQEVDVKHIPFNVKIQAPFQPRKIAMIVGGTGITPMIQALHAILGKDEGNDSDSEETEGKSTDEKKESSNSSSEEKKQQVIMFYGSRDASDILGREMLDNWAETCSDQFKLVHVLSNEPKESEWKGKRGFIDKLMLEEYLPKPNEDCIIFVCGPPAMYDVFCGPRNAPELTGILAELGYKAEQVYKF